MPSNASDDTKLALAANSLMPLEVTDDTKNALVASARTAANIESAVVTVVTTTSPPRQHIQVLKYAQASDVPFEWPHAGAGLKFACEPRSVRELLLSLLDNRDFLGHQLSHAMGILQDAEFESIADSHFASIGLESDEHLLPRVALLHDILADRLDTDVAAAALRCELEQAERLLTRVAAMVAKREAPLAITVTLNVDTDQE